MAVLVRYGKRNTSYTVLQSAHFILARVAAHKKQTTYSYVTVGSARVGWSLGQWICLNRANKVTVRPADPCSLASQIMQEKCCLTGVSRRMLVQYSAAGSLSCARPKVPLPGRSRRRQEIGRGRDPERNRSSYLFCQIAVGPVITITPLYYCCCSLLTEMVLRR
jgi:hypothetical protein